LLDRCQLSVQSSALLAGKILLELGAEDAPAFP
jgi:hypothetical protein